MLTEVITNLWLSDYNSIKNNVDFLENKNIKLIINCSKTIPFKKFMKKCKLIRYEMDDHGKINFNKLFKINQMIYNYLNKNLGILCFCFEGIQCSPCIISSYLIHYGKMDTSQITSSLQSKNCKIFNPNNNFKLCLDKYNYQLLNKK